jgi:hypothetical protein
LDGGLRTVRHRFLRWRKGAASLQLRGGSGAVPPARGILRTLASQGELCRRPSLGAVWSLRGREVRGLLPAARDVRGRAARPREGEVEALLGTVARAWVGISRETSMGLLRLPCSSLAGTPNSRPGTPSARPMYRTTAATARRRAPGAGRWKCSLAKRCATPWEAGSAGHRGSSWTATAGWHTWRNARALGVEDGSRTGRGRRGGWGRAYPLFEEGPAGVTGRHQGGES